MQKYLYFRTDADEDDDASAADSVMYPLSSFKGMHPTAAAAITLFFEPQIRVRGEGANATGNFTNNDSVILNITEGTAFEVMRDLTTAFAGQGGALSVPFLTVADDMTTLLDNTTRDAIYLVPNILSCGAISVGAAFAD
tara:strand:+ start:102 stop:518 length:417 start_codon:yes stop_codon:yes gene_type:complete